MFSSSSVAIGSIQRIGQISVYILKKMWGCSKCMGNKYIAVGMFVFMSNTGVYPWLDCSN